jgi:hypothetical protein
MRTLRELVQIVQPTQTPLRVSNIAAMLDVVSPISLRQLLTWSIFHVARLETLTCHVTEDSGADECRLDIYVDGALEFPLLKDLSPNDPPWSLQQEFLFTRTVEVKLRDEDSPDPDDRLGWITIPAAPAQHATAGFSEDEASYTLSYSVGLRLMPPSFDLVQQAIVAFEQSTHPGVWPQLDKATLIDDLRATVLNPLQVQQRSTPLCGPAAVAYELVSRQPQRYVWICQALYETGQFEARTRQVKPSATLLNSGIAETISIADWLLLASLRDDENWLLPVDADSRPLALGVTTPWEMRDWAFDILGYDATNYDGTVFTGEIDAIRIAQKAWERGGVAFLNIDANLLQGDDPKHIPDHWVAFTGGLQIDDASETISFTCYSWTKIHTVSMKQADFAKYMFGVVTGEP